MLLCIPLGLTVLLPPSVANSPLPPAPEYASPAAWAAWPGHASGADAVPVADRTADVFFIHPTTHFGAAANARFDEPGVTCTRLDQGVLRFQASVFNTCCRIYAPRCRQAALGAFLTADTAHATTAYKLAYGVVCSAFDYYIDRENHGRPFILVSHSQGSPHAMRLLQERLAGSALQPQLVVAYIVGYSLPEEIERSGVPVCRTPRTTGCLVDWNTAAEGTRTDRRRAERLVWLDGRYRPLAGRHTVCIDPLSWAAGGAAPATLNLGALPAVAPAEALRAPIPEPTGARRDGGLLRVAIPWSERRGCADLLTFFGRYHVFDYNLFYTNIRVNAAERAAAHRACSREVP